MSRSARPIESSKARGGDIVLRRPWERVVFIAALIGCVVLGAVLALLRWWS